MGIFPDIFKSQVYNAEIRKVQDDISKILKYFELLGPNVKSFEYNEHLVILLENPDFHPVAKLVIIFPNALESINQYTSFLELAKKGNTDAVYHIEDIKKNAIKLIESKAKLLKVEFLSAEADKVLADQNAVIQLRESVFPNDESDPDQMIPWYEERIKILNNESFNLVARLSFSRRYDLFVSDYIRKMKLASKGDKVSLSRIEEDRVKALNMISYEVLRLKKNLEAWKDARNTLESSGLLKWVELKQKVRKQCLDEQVIFDSFFPKDKRNLEKIKDYYEKRISRLEVSELSPIAKLVWITTIKDADKKKLVEGFFDVLNRLVRGELIEQNLQDIVKRAETVVNAEATYLRKRFADIFAVQVG